MGNSPSEITVDDVAEFEAKHPDVKIKFVTVTTTLLTAMFAAGNPPDVVRDQGVPNTPYLVKRGLAENLDPYFAKSAVLAPDKLAQVNDTWRYDGKEQGKVRDTAWPRTIPKTRWRGATPRYSTMPELIRRRPPIRLSYDEMLDLGKRLTKRKRRKVREIWRRSTV